MRELTSLTLMDEELLLKNCRYVVTPDEVLERVDVLVVGNRIEAVGEALSSSGEVIDCSSGIVMPGLVNAHTHAAMVLFRGYYDDAELEEWLKKLWEAERRLDYRLVYLASKLAAYEMVSTGTTAIVDMYFYPEATAKAVVEAGLRTMLGPVFLDRLVSSHEAARALKSLVSAYSGSRLVTPIVNVHSIYACSEETLLLAAELADRLDLRVHIHVSETRREVYECKKRHGLFPVEYLDRLGLLTNRTHLVHLGWVTSWEIGLIREKGATVAHCPTSNMKLATAGFFPFKEMVRSGIPVGIGTGGAATNNSLDMFREMKMTVLLQRNNYWDADVCALDALRAATLNGARILGKRVGRVAEGYLADLVVVDARSPRLQPLRRDNVVSALVYVATGADVAVTIVDGKVVYRREEESKVREEAVRIARELNEFFRRLTASFKEG